MIVTRHISLDDDCISKMQPYVLRHNGNFSAAVRDIIDHVGKSVFPNNSAAMESSLFKWMLKGLEGVLVPDSVLNEMLDPMLINSMRRFEEYINYRFNELEWDINVSIKSDKDTLPSDVLAEIRGTPPRTKFVACLISQFLVQNSFECEPLGIRSVVNLNECMKIEFFRSNKNEAIGSLITYFGGMDEVVRGIRSRPAFWKAVINRHIISNYNMITVHKNYFEDLLTNNIPMGEITIENLAKKPIEEIPLKEMLSLIKEVYETSRVVDRVEIDKDNIILFHGYRAKEATEKIKKILVTLLEANGHLYDAKSTANMIVLTHRPDVGIKVNEIVDNLKTSNGSMDQELIMFMTFLRGLKDIPDIPLSMTALGRKIGKTLMQEYEKEKGIKHWDLDNFKNAFELINSRLHIECDWKLEGKNLLYTVRKCNIANEGNKFDKYVCHTAREAFKGALTHAFGNGAELEIKKLLSHGDNLCEVVIRVP
jgi:predicted hydrocarbon binding protein